LLDEAVESQPVIYGIPNMCDDCRKEAGEAK